MIMRKPPQKNIPPFPAGQVEEKLAFPPLDLNKNAPLMGFFCCYLPFRKGINSSVQYDFRKKIPRQKGGVFFIKKEIEKRRKI